MSTEMQPPRALPLRVVGWLSLPWRHWIYIIGTLLFGLFFVTLAPFPFLVRVLVLLIPFFTAMLLAMPYGGLHLDEWILMALKYRMRPSATTISPEELKGQTPEELQRLLEAGLQEEESAGAAGYSLAGAQPEDGRGWQPAGGWTANGPALDQGAPSSHQIYLTGTHGILRRGYTGAAIPFQAYDGQAQYPQSFQPTGTEQSSHPARQSAEPTQYIAPDAPGKPKKRRLW
jgi:hypothetical protein